MSAPARFTAVSCCMAPGLRLRPALPGGKRSGRTSGFGPPARHRSHVMQAQTAAGVRPAPARPLSPHNPPTLPLPSDRYNPKHGSKRHNQFHFTEPHSA